ncbi:low-density lipoprotein receptor-related protein 2-like [Pollicipes pollicipes]|uniref:low-density lipoprotein receptor-related protein 2-like n=1 Tax=Pollicipes pollicipes TaxID=41117 RepID=UPI00188581FA|nr:low-density lipoprotein receptor-related protein 2-like [Pollicipes pollicipes]
MRTLWAWCALLLLGASWGPPSAAPFVLPITLGAIYAADPLRVARCGVGEFRCTDGRACLQATSRCDGQRDCRDGSDELACVEFTRSPEEVKAQCVAPNLWCGFCVFAEWKCDGEVDCLDGADEAGCPDERDCAPKAAAACRAGQFRCSDGGRCVEAARVCDTHTDCADASDEGAGCARRDACRNGTCPDAYNCGRVCYARWCRSGHERLLAVAGDLASRTVYWSFRAESGLSGVRRRADFQSANAEPFVLSGQGTVEALAWEWVARALYMADVDRRRLAACNWLGHCAVVDPAAGRLYWSDADRRLLESARLDGSRRRPVPELLVRAPFSLAVLGPRLIWSDYDAEEVHGCDKDTGKNRSVVLKRADRWSYRLQALHSSLQPPLDNPCVAARCAHLCLLSSTTAAGYRCFCAEDMELAADGFSCLQGNASRVVVAGSEHLLDVSVNVLGGPGAAQLTAFPARMVTAVALDYLPSEGGALNLTLLYADAAADKIFSCDLDERRRRVLIGGHVTTVVGLAVDPVRGNVYWADSARGVVELFACRSGACLQRAWLCDGSPDCPAGDDELDCPERRAVTCGPGHFNCSSGECVSAVLRCDGASHCGDASDERDCARHTCADGQFRCGTGFCVSAHYRCDQHSDCMDGSDEAHCRAADCPNGTFTCASSGRCVPAHWFCDGQRACDDGRCLSAAAFCDGAEDCAGGEDEADCGGVFCRGTRHRIDPRWLCDGEADCSDGWDEAHAQCAGRPSPSFETPQAGRCRDDQYACADGFRCVDVGEVCDGVAHCADRSDEGGLCGEACTTGICADRCRPTPTAPVCGCADGFELRDDGKTCRDVDECARGAPCAQLCNNTEGGFRCDCRPGYWLEADGARCRSTVSPTLLMTRADSVIADHVRSRSVNLVYRTTNATLAFTDYDAWTQTLYFYDSYQGGVFAAARGGVLADGTGAARADGEAAPRLLVTNVTGLTALALEWTTKNVYLASRQGDAGVGRCGGLDLDRASGRVWWFDSHYHRLGATPLAGGGAQRQLDVPGMHQPRGLAVFEDWAYVRGAIVPLVNGSADYCETVHDTKMEQRAVDVVHRLRQPLLLGLENGAESACRAHARCRYMCLPHAGQVACYCPDNQPDCQAELGTATGSAGARGATIGTVLCLTALLLAAAALWLRRRQRRRASRPAAHNQFQNPTYDMTPPHEAPDLGAPATWLRDADGDNNNADSGGGGGKRAAGTDPASFGSIYDDGLKMKGGHIELGLGARSQDSGFLELGSVGFSSMERLVQ